MTTKEQFIEMAKGITRPGIDQMMAWLETTDFYTAPASTRFHGAEEGGLCAHSITVAKRLLEIADLWAPNQYSRDALLTVALFHDLCKISTYTVSTRNVNGPAMRCTRCLGCCMWRMRRLPHLTKSNRTSQCCSW